MKYSRIFLASLSMLGALTMFATTDAMALTTQINVTVANLRNQKGSICLTLFNDAQGFPSQSDRSVASRCVSPEDATSGVIFDNLVPGSYAIAVIHDENKDGMLNTGLFGIPKEGFGFSQNPKVGMGAPSFKDTALLISEPKTQVQINLKYIF